MMALKNYTSQVSASTSIGWIEDKLARHGARQILKEYSPGGQVTSVAFIIHVNGIELPFHLPARIEACEKVLKAEVRRPNKDTYKRIAEQAERTAWKIVADWVDAQMAMIELSQVDILEVFLPYLYDRGKKLTFYQTLLERGIQKALPAFCSAAEQTDGD